jgi:hypothetical protein
MLFFMRMAIFAATLFVCFCLVSRLRYIPLGPGEVFDTYFREFCTPRGCVPVPSGLVPP